MKCTWFCLRFVYSWKCVTKGTRAVQICVFGIVYYLLYLYIHLNENRMNIEKPARFPLIIFHQFNNRSQLVSFLTVSNGLPEGVLLHFYQFWDVLFLIVLLKK